MFCRLRRKFTTKANNFHSGNLVGKHHLLIGRRGETVQGQRRIEKKEGEYITKYESSRRGRAGRKIARAGDYFLE